MCKYIETVNSKVYSECVYVLNSMSVIVYLARLYSYGVTICMARNDDAMKTMCIVYIAHIACASFLYFYLILLFSIFVGAKFCI